MKKILLPLIFVIIIIAPAFDVVFKISPSGNINENRVKAKIPEFSKVGFEKYPMAFENYFSDNFNLRSDLLIFNAFIKFNILHISPFKDQVMIGKDGWLFIQKYFPVFQAKEHFDKEELQHFKRLFDLREEWLSKRSIKMYLAIVPVSTSVYPEYLPSNAVSFNAVNKTDSLINYLNRNSGVKIIDLRKAMQIEKSKGALRMFHKTDQHWNEYGSLMATKAIIDTLRINFPQIKNVDLINYKIDSTESAGLSMAGIILKKDEMKEMNITATPKNGFKAEKVVGKNYPIPETFPYKGEYELNFEVKSLKSPKIMVLRDSYAVSMMKYLNEYFGHSIYIWDDWAYRLNEDIVESEKPDIVLFQIIEADLYNMIYGTDTEIRVDSIKRFRYTRHWINDPEMVKKTTGANDHF